MTNSEKTLSQYNVSVLKRTPNPRIFFFIG